MDGEALPLDEIVQAVLAKLVPDFVDFQLRELGASFANLTHLVEYERRGGENGRFVLRRYNPANGNCAQKARVEYYALNWLQQQDVSVPKALLLDDTGELLGTPGIVTEFVSGTQEMEPVDEVVWAQKLARMLAKIHAITPDDQVKPHLLDGDAEIVWFIHSGEVPEYMRVHPDGERVWHAVRNAWPKRQRVMPKLVHIDYWQGNVLWLDGEITAVVDWEEAAYGDPGIDVAYAMMDLYLSGRFAAYKAYLPAYEAEAGQAVANLGMWQLAAAVRPMFSVSGWGSDQSPMKERLREFIVQALEAVGRD